MGHTASNKDDLLKRVKRIAGQIQAVERALESDADCAKTLHLVAATRGAINGLMDDLGGGYQLTEFDLSVFEKLDDSW